MILSLIAKRKKKMRLFSIQLLNLLFVWHDGYKKKKTGQKLKLFSDIWLSILFKEDFMLGNPNAQRIALKKTFCSKSSPRLILSIFEQKQVFLSGMRCALGFPKIKSSLRQQLFFDYFFFTWPKFFLLRVSLPRQTAKHENI